MNRPLNPFYPSTPASPNQFVGRHAEIQELDAALTHTERGRPRHFLITGERGIGKTSFLDYIRIRASSGYASDGFNYIVIDLSINQQTSQLDLAKKLQHALSEQLSKFQPIKDLIGKTWEFVKKFEAMGISYKADKEDAFNHRDIYIDVTDSLMKVVDSICASATDDVIVYGYDGILILIDEVDQSSASLNLGEFLKSMLERLNRKGCKKIIVGMAGLKSSIDVLIASHPSSLRIFDELPLGNLRLDDVKELLDDASREVKADGFDNFSISDEAKSWIYEISGGHPYFVHQIGYCAFEEYVSEADYSEPLNKRHVINGSFQPRGALEVIGNIYLDEKLKLIEHDEIAMEILDQMTDTPGHRLKIESITETLNKDSTTIKPNLASIIDAGLVVKNHDSLEFRFKCTAYWLQIKRPKEAV